jgi:hypothetical protein
MRKLSCLLLFLLQAGFVLAQTPKLPVYTYCQLTSGGGASGFFSNKIEVLIDYGQLRQSSFDNIIIDEQTGKAQQFNSMIDAVNFMGSKGWELVQTFVIPSKTEVDCLWLLKKLVTDEDKSNYLPLIKKDVKKRK